MNSSICSQKCLNLVSEDSPHLGDLRSIRLMYKELFSVKEVVDLYSTKQKARGLEKLENFLDF